MISFHPGEISQIRRKLIEWGRKNFRPFPWRYEKDPYRVLISEILLHRTRAEQVVPVYLEFINKYPDIRSLASADLQDIETILYPLGLRWRVKKMKEMAEVLVNRYGGRIPSSRTELESLPGISSYIASAVRCFAYGEADVILDTNTVRILGRLLDLTVNDSSRRSRKFMELMRKLLDRENPREFNYSLLDLGALVCHKRSPDCLSCPLSEHCRYHLKILSSK